jgi:hypothetical protein
MKIRAIVNVLLLTLVAAVCAALLSAPHPVLSGKEKPGTLCLTAGQKVSQSPLLNTTICFPDIGGGD